MKQSDKLKVLIDSIKTANELAAKQIEKNRRSIELLGEFITEPETLGKAPHSHNVPNLPNMVGEEIELCNELVTCEEAIKWWVNLTNDEQWQFRYELIGHRGGILLDSEIEEIWRKKTKQVEPETIKPEDMKAGEWYVVEIWYNWMFKFKKISKEQIYTFKHASLDGEDYSLNGGNLTQLNRIKSLRKANQEEILKYFPNELEVPTHGGNDAAYIQEVTNKKL